MNKVKNTIVDVFEDNFIYEIKRMSSFLEKYNFVAMDTEFPGIVYQLKDWVKDFYYKTIKMNVDNLKVIQVRLDDVTFNQYREEANEFLKKKQF